MKKKDGNKLFWISYSDLMTSLFFVMLVLFSIISVKYFVLKERIIEAGGEKGGEITEEVLDSAIINIIEQKKYIDIVGQFEPLQKSGSFVYKPESNKYVAKDFIGEEIFDPNQVAIRKKYLPKVRSLGHEVEDLLKTLSENPETKGHSYLLVIEGNMANTYDYQISKENNDGYTKSYGRALAVYKTWVRDSIDLRKYNTEVLICGSGFNGIDRDPIEDNNKRFSIQIYPKVKDPRAKN